MKDTIDKLVDIDNQSRAVINKCEEKEENLDNYVTIELEKRKAEINAKYKYKINFLKSECDKDFSNKKEEIDENTKKVIQDIQNDYNEKKDEKINEYFKKNQYDRIIEIYEKRLLDIQKNEKKMARKQKLKSFVRRLIKE